MPLHWLDAASIVELEDGFNVENTAACCLIASRCVLGDVFDVGNGVTSRTHIRREVSQLHNGALVHRFLLVSSAQLGIFEGAGTGITTDRQISSIVQLL